MLPPPTADFLLSPPISECLLAAPISDFLLPAPLLAPTLAAFSLPLMLAGCILSWPCLDGDMLGGAAVPETDLDLTVSCEL